MVPVSAYAATEQPPKLLLTKRAPLQSSRMGPRLLRASALAADGRDPPEHRLQLRTHGRKPSDQDAESLRIKTEASLVKPTPTSSTASFPVKIICARCSRGGCKCVHASFVSRKVARLSVRGRNEHRN
eukprot:6025920-Pleurochrysis_carterae.AAC.4